MGVYFDGYANTNGEQYVAYLFAHNAGGFGLTGTDNVITCGSFTTDGSGLASINLGYEPQWVLYKRTNAAEDWFVRDNMRGWSKSTNAFLRPNLSDAELVSNGDYTSPNATGFEAGPTAGAFSASSTYIYIAIRRGPMKVPTSGTSVFEPALYTGDGATSRTFTSSTVSPIDSVISMQRGGDGNIWWVDRLRGDAVIRTIDTAAETGAFSSLKFDYQNGYSNNANPVYFGWNVNTASDLNYFFKRAPSFFDEVCYTGTGSALSVSHNLGVTPELIIAKKRSGTGEWCVSASVLPWTSFLFLQSTAAKATFTMFDPVTASAFTVQPGGAADSGSTYVAYLFATCAGVSKVGSYTGTGTTKQVDCGFTGGARFVLIKRTDSTGDWYVWDSARGIVAGNDPYLLLNSTAAEVTSTDYVDTYSAGFEISSTAPAAINASGGTFIFLAIA
jgi:hypothetical protein